MKHHQDPSQNPENDGADDTDTNTNQHWRLMFSVHHAYWLGDRCEKLYRRFDILLGCVQIVGGSGVALAAFGDSRALTVVAALIVACTSALSLLAHPGVTAVHYKITKDHASDLMTKGKAMSEEKLGQALSDLIKQSQPAPNSLRNVAYNQTAKYFRWDEYTKKLSRFERLMATIT